MAKLVYKPNEKHKRGAFGEGPPRWFPDADTLCPDDLDTLTCQELLEGSIEGRDQAHPDRRARYALHRGEFYKAYPERTDGELELWHGYPVERGLVHLQVPARVLRQLRDRGQLTRAEYNRLLGSAR